MYLYLCNHFDRVSLNVLSLNFLMPSLPLTSDDCPLFHDFSPVVFSFCRPLAKEHIRRNRQSRTFLVENVIGEIWSELEEGSVLECPLALAGLFFVYSCWQKCIFICSFCTFGKRSKSLGFKDHSPWGSSLWSCNFACYKTIQTLQKKGRDWNSPVPEYIFC